MKVWLTKYALTSGVRLVSAKPCNDTSDRMIEVRPGEYYHKPDWHETKAEAVARVKVMVDARLRRLRKQMDKLDAIRAGVWQGAGKLPMAKEGRK